MLYNVLMTKKIALYNSNIEETIKNYFKEQNCTIEKMLEIKNFSDFDIVVLWDYNDTLPQNNNHTIVLNIHPSLLPAFGGENAIEQALKFGSKVSGITIHNAYTGQIIAQFPVLIGIDTGVSEFIKEMTEIEKHIIPPVIDAVLNDRVFDFGDILNQNTCSHKNCSKNCKNCH